MKFIELQIKGFGKFHDRTISFQDGLNIVYGKNEAGKSTIHAFIRGMLFGIQPQRGRASKNDVYSRYEPWENSEIYEGVLRLEQGGHIYRIERIFEKSKKELHIVDETLGKSLFPSKALLDQLLCGLNETTYNNTISISQLKCATDAGMTAELKNYIANMNTTGNTALNITKATDYLKSQKKNLESQLVPEAVHSYTALLGEIRALEEEVSSPEYTNQLPIYQKLRTDTKSEIQQKQIEKGKLLQKLEQARQILSQNQFSNIQSIEEYQEKTLQIFKNYQSSKTACEKKSQKAFRFALFFVAACFFAGGLYCYWLGEWNPITDYLFDFNINFPGIAVFAVMATISILLYVIGFFSLWKRNQLEKELTLSSQVLQESFSRHLGDGTISSKAMDSFKAQMAEFMQLSTAADQYETNINQLADEIISLQEKQNNFSQIIEKQQQLQWELEKKLELLSDYKTEIEILSHTLAENNKISQEIAAINLAGETMTTLSSSIRDSFGLYLNKTASDFIKGITGGVYISMSIDENLNPFMNTPTRLVPLEQVSSGTMDQIYLALRLATAKLIQSEYGESMPLVFDDSFVLYDEDRLKSTLEWLYATYGSGQMILFTCHQREGQMLTKSRIPYHLIKI
ncbi:MAG: AAA family ATPase [Hungatella sp.]|nr:AAA family ATPase [Hungatella sp.]